MNFSNPILICNQNEEFRILIRDMLMKNGFFHVMEASSLEEAKVYLNLKNDYFVLIDSQFLSSEVTVELFKQKDFLIFADNSDPKTLTMAAKLGVHRILSYPLHSRKLMHKMNSLI